MYMSKNVVKPFQIYPVECGTKILHPPYSVE